MIDCARIIIVLILVREVCLTDKIYFSTWIKPILDLNWNIIEFETVLGKSIDYCIGSCKAKKMCKYMNFNVKAGVCSLIAYENVSASLSFDRSNPIVEQKKGYVLGKKHDWNIDVYESCKDCEPNGVCKEGNEGKFIQQYSKCQSSGCVAPDVKDNAVVHGNLYSIGDKIEYKCQTNYTDVSSGTRISICQNTGVWTPVNIKCIEDHLAPYFYNNSVYLLDKTMRRWNDGKIYCERIGGKLADIKTQEENDFIMKNVFVQNHAYGEWIGAYDRDNTDTWKWLDGSLVSDGFSNWGIGQPTNSGENCLLIYNDLLWHDAYCEWYTWSLCKIRISYK